MYNKIYDEMVVMKNIQNIGQLIQRWDIKMNGYNKLYCKVENFFKVIVKDT